MALVVLLDGQWDADLRTWVDAGDSDSSSGRARTLDALLPVLASNRAEALDAAFADLTDPAAFGGPCGPTGVHRSEPSFAARTYWRGPAWPQLTYLMWVAARRRGRSKEAEALGAMLVRGAVASGWAEYWDADDGTGLGAAPQSWAALAAVVAATELSG
jgi:glycogen debranching enzyme